jgi:hypothetical protein
MKLNTDTKLIVAGVIVLGFGAWYVQRQARAAIDNAYSGVGGILGSVGQSVSGIWDSIGNGGIGNAVNAAGVGVVENIGLAVGIPRTNMTECERAKAEGRWWDASFACPAGDFISSGASAAWGSSNVNQATQADVRRIDNAIDYRTDANPFVNQAGYDFRYF